MPDEIDALIKFSPGWVEDGLSEDGLPSFKETILITLAKPPYTLVERVATQEEIENPQFAGPWKMFQNSAQARKADVEGYPLALWVAISPAEFQMCAVRGIVTVEQLAKVSGDTAPPEIRELVARAKKMVDLQKNVGRFEAKILELTGERDALQAELTEARQALSAQNAMIDKLQSKSKAA